jgi:hypothetical protein
MSKYTTAAQKLVREAGYDGGPEALDRALPILYKLADMARREEGDEIADQILELEEALSVANL